MNKHVLPGDTDVFGGILMNHNTYYLYKMWCPHCGKLMQTQSLQPPSFYCAPCAYRATIQYVQDSSANAQPWATTGAVWQEPAPLTEIPPGIRRAFAYDDLLEYGHIAEGDDYEEEGV